LQSCGDSADKKETPAQDTVENAAEESTTTTEATTPAPTTEPPTTTEKPPIITEEILKWTFSEDDKVFKVGNQTSNFRVEDGILKCTSTGGDPFLYTVNANLGIEASDVDYIKFHVKNLSEGFDNQIFFITTDEVGWDEPKSIREDYFYSEGENWEILVYDTSDCDLWEGTIKQIRFDYLTVEGDFEIEWVVFEKIVK
jgi:hypothetical protein